MKTQDLITIWGAPDHSKLTPKQLSIRLPLIVAAKINALCDMYPRRSKTEIISDLLATTLDQLEAEMPSSDGKFLAEDPDTGEKYYEQRGMRANFQKLYTEHLEKLESEL